MGLFSTRTCVFCLFNVRHMLKCMLCVSMSKAWNTRAKAVKCIQH